MKQDFGAENAKLLRIDMAGDEGDFIPRFIQNRGIKSRMPSYTEKSRGRNKTWVYRTFDVAADLGVLLFLKTGSYEPLKLRYKFNLYGRPGFPARFRKVGPEYEVIPCDNPDLPNLNRVVNEDMQKVYDSVKPYLRSKIGSYIVVGVPAAEED